MPETKQGTIKYFNGQKGFGFITPEDGGPDVFVHISEIQKSGLTTLEEGQKVSFSTVKGPKGLSATNLSVV